LAAAVKVGVKNSRLKEPRQAGADVVVSREAELTSSEHFLTIAL
jgi:hypothetical protein